MFEFGDIPLWLYSSNMLLKVEILEATPPAMCRRQPSYHVKFVAGQGSRVGTHNVHHDYLFTPRDSSAVLDPNGRLDANLDSLRMGDQLAAHKIPDVSDLLIERWGGMDLDSSKIKDFIATFKDEVLSSDALTALETFYYSLQITPQSAYCQNIDILPEISKLSPLLSLRDIVLPPPPYAHFDRVRTCYNSIGRVLHQVLHRSELTAKAHLAREAL